MKLEKKQKFGNKKNPMHALRGIPGVSGLFTS